MTQSRVEAGATEKKYVQRERKEGRLQWNNRISNYCSQEFRRMLKVGEPAPLSVYMNKRVIEMISNRREH